VPGEAEHQQALGAGSLETLVDAAAPALAEGALLPGGTRLFRDQSACPFRAFAHVRLGCQALAEPAPGLDAATRGTLLHDALRALWQQLGSHARLMALGEVELTREVARAVEAAIGQLALRRRETFTARFRALEQQRLEGLVQRWLALERERAPFVVRARETRVPLSLGGLRVEVVADRVDEIDDGGLVILDYKTGKAKTADWYGARPAEPQLPLYAIAAPGTVAALTFARLRADACDFRGLARDSGLLPAVETLAADKHAGAFGSWEALLNSWRETLAALAADFRAGAAAVDPRDGRTTCEQCDLEPLCRVHEHPRWGDVLPEEPA
jgi:probable DNA repair protein